MLTRVDHSMAPKSNAFRMVAAEEDNGKWKGDTFDTDAETRLFIS